MLQEKSKADEKHGKDIAIKMKQIVRLKAKLKKSEMVSPCEKYQFHYWSMTYYENERFQNMLIDLLFFHKNYPWKTTQGVLKPFHGQLW